MVKIKMLTPNSPTPS